MRKDSSALLLMFLVVMAGCASPIPSAIRAHRQADAVTVQQAQQAPQSYEGRQVRWGGSILSVRNLADSTEIEVLSRPLTGDGKPRAGADGQGRFIARVLGFIDPAEYPQARLLTVVGTIGEVETRDVGDYPYPYPVVAVTSRYLWPETKVYDFPYGYPFYNGYYGYGPWYGPGFGPWYRPWYGPW